MQRTALIAGAVVVAVLAFLVLRPKDDSRSATTTTKSAKSTKSKSATTTTSARTAERNHEAVPARAGAATVRLFVAKGRAVGGVKRIVLTSGDRARIVVSTGDTTSTVHLHGYDIERKLAPGRPVTLAFPAKLEGIFALELHETDAEIAKVEVRP